MRLRDVETETLGIEVHLVGALLQNARDIPRVLKLSEINITARLLDGVSDEFGGASFTLGAHDHGLLLLAGLVDHKGGALGFLLGDLFGFDGGGEFRGEGEVL